MTWTNISITEPPEKQQTARFVYLFDFFFLKGDYLVINPRHFCKVSIQTRVGPCVLHSGKVETKHVIPHLWGETLCHSTKLEVFVTSFAVLTPGGQDGLFKMDPAGSVPSISRYVSASAPYYIGNLQ